MEPVSTVQPQPAAPAPAKEAPKAPKKKMSRNKKIVLIAVAVVVVLIGARALTMRQCFRHSFGTNCEWPAWDGGKSCVSDDGCSTGLCVYSTDTASAVDAMLGGGARGEVIPKTDHGHCDTFEGDNDGVTICHRPTPTGPLVCFSVISQGRFDISHFAVRR